MILFRAGDDVFSSADLSVISFLFEENMMVLVMLMECFSRNMVFFD